MKPGRRKRERSRLITSTQTMDLYSIFESIHENSILKIDPLGLGLDQLSPPKSKGVVLTSYFLTRQKVSVKVVFIWKRCCATDVKKVLTITSEATSMSTLTMHAPWFHTCLFYICTRPSWRHVSPKLGTVLL